MFKLIKLIIIILIFQSCTKSNYNLEKNDKSIIIKLTKKINNDIKFRDNFSLLYARPLIDKFPKYYNYQLKYKGLDHIDSTIISTLNTDRKKFYYNLFKNGFINNSDYSNLRIDSIKEKAKPNQKQLLIASIFSVNKQILIVDENDNQDFSDDRKVTFDRDFRFLANDTNKIKALPIYNFNYWYEKNQQIINLNRKVIIYPFTNPNYFESTDSEIYKRSGINIKFKDYWAGEINLDGHKYDIAIQGHYDPYLYILIKPDSLAFSKVNYIYNENYNYKLKDIVKIADKIYVIDSITNDISKLVLKWVEDKSCIYGHRPGQTIENLELEDLAGEKLNIYNITKQKNYTLLDFWGTWCKPCRELTPELIKLQQEHSSDLSIISIAFDKKKESVKNYTVKNKMNWTHTYVERDFNNRNAPSILNNLRITEYPTLILMNNENKILFRGAGTEALDKIKTIIKDSL